MSRNSEVDLQVEARHARQVRQVLVHQAHQAELGDLHLPLRDEAEQQVEGALEHRGGDLVAHGVGLMVLPPPLPRTAFHERSAAAQLRPVVGGDIPRAPGVVVAGEGHDQGLGPGGLQVGGPGRPVPQVGREAARPGQAAGARAVVASDSAERAEPRLALADVVEQGGPGQVGPAGPARRAPPGRTPGRGAGRPRGCAQKRPRSAGRSEASRRRLLRRGAAARAAAPRRNAAPGGAIPASDHDPYEPADHGPHEPQRPGDEHDERGGARGSRRGPGGSKPGPPAPGSTRGTRRLPSRGGMRQHVEHGQGAVDQHEGEQHPSPEGPGGRPDADAGPEDAAAPEQRRGPPRGCAGPPGGRGGPTTTASVRLLAGPARLTRAIPSVGRRKWAGSTGTGTGPTPDVLPGERRAPPGRAASRRGPRGGWGSG